VTDNGAKKKVFKDAMMPLLRLQNGHVLATLCAVVLALYEGRTGLPIVGFLEQAKHVLLLYCWQDFWS